MQLLLGKSGNSEIDIKCRVEEGLCPLSLLLLFGLGFVILGYDNLEQVTFDQANNAFIYSFKYSCTVCAINILIAVWTHNLFNNLLINISIYFIFTYLYIYAFIYP